MGQQAARPTAKVSKAFKSQRNFAYVRLKKFDAWEGWHTKPPSRGVKKSDTRGTNNKDSWAECAEGEGQMRRVCAAGPIVRRLHTLVGYWPWFWQHRGRSYVAAAGPRSSLPRPPPHTPPRSPPPRPAPITLSRPLAFASRESIILPFPSCKTLTLGIIVLRHSPPHTPTPTHPCTPIPPPAVLANLLASRAAASTTSCPSPSSQSSPPPPFKSFFLFFLLSLPCSHPLPLTSLGSSPTSVPPQRPPAQRSVAASPSFPTCHSTSRPSRACSHS